MLNKKNRLTSYSAFCATYNNKNSVSNDSIILYAGKLKTNESCPTRVGFVVSKKVHKRAVKRNRIKRLIRENIRLLIKDGCKELERYQSLIFVAKDDVLEKDFEEIRKMILTLLQKLANKNI